MHALTTHRAVHSVRARTSRPSITARVAPARLRRATRIAPAAASVDDVTGDMLYPSIWNTPAARLVTVGAGAVITAAATAAASPALGPAALHVMSWATGLGTMLYTTFFLGIAMFKNLPRQVFGKLQAKLFPIYFSVLAASFVVQLATLALGPGLAQPQAITLGVGLATTVANLLVVEPASTASMFKRYALESVGAAARDDAEVKRLKQEFGKLHGLSSLLNLASLVCAVSHGVWLASGASLAPVGEVLLRVALRK